MKVKVMAAAALLMTAAVAASAQPGGGGGGRRGGGFGQGRGGGLQLLRIVEVQEELKMTAAQKEKVDAKQQEVGAAMRELFQNAGGGGGGGGFNPEMMAKMQEIQTKAVNDILDTTQQKRYHQLQLQQMGIAGVVGQFGPKADQEKLNLNADQKAKIQAIQQEQQNAQREVFQGLQGATPEEQQAARQKMATMRTENTKKIEALLTDAQRATWKEMTGAPFKFPAMGPGGPGGRRGGGGGNPPPPPAN